MFAQINFDVNIALADKENVGMGTPFSEKPKAVSKFSSPFRTPLQDIRQTSPQARVQKRMQYSPTTPYSALSEKSSNKIQSRKSCTPRGRNLREDKLKEWQDNTVMLNAVLYNEALKVVDNATKGLRSKLSEKDEYIKTLENEIERLSSSDEENCLSKDGQTSFCCTPNNQDTPNRPHSPESTTNIADSLKWSRVPVSTPLMVNSHSVEMSTSGTNDGQNAARHLANKERQNISILHSEIEIENDEIFVSPTHSSSCSPHPTPRPLKAFDPNKIQKPKRSKLFESSRKLLPNKNTVAKTNAHTTTETACSPIPIKRFSNLMDISNSVTVYQDSDESDRTAVSCSETMTDGEEKSLNAGIDSSPNKKFNAATCTTPLKCVESGVCQTTKVNIDTGCKSSPKTMVNCEVACSPLKTSHIATDITPKKLQDSATSPTKSACSEIGTMYTPCKLSDANNGTPIKHEDFGSAMSPLSVANTSIQMTPKKLQDSATSPTKSACSEIGTMYTPCKHSDANTGTPIKYEDFGSAMSPLSVANTSIQMTPKNVCESGTAVSPVPHFNIYTEVTPVKMTNTSSNYTPLKVQDMGCGNEPIILESRMIGTSPTRVTDMETMVTPPRMMSIETYYTPIKLQDMGCETNQVTLQDASIATMSPQLQDTSSMVTPIKMEDCQVATSPIALVEVDTFMTPVKTCDISTAMTPDQYKQSNVFDMLQSLHLEYAKTKHYRTRYEEAMQKNAELKSQLQVFVELGDILNKVASSQNEANQSLHEGFLKVKELDQKVKLERQTLESERELFNSDKMVQDKSMEETMKKYNEMKEEYDTFHRRVEIAEEKSQQNEKELLLCQEAVNNSNKQIAELNKKMQCCIQDKEASLEAMETLNKKVTELRKQNENLRQTYHSSQGQFQRLQRGAKEAEERYESDRFALQEELEECKSEKETVQMELSRRTADLTQIRHQLVSVEEELEATKSSAQLMIMSQGSEISNSIVAVGKMGEQLYGLHDQLKSITKLWKSKEVKPSDSDEDSNDSVENAGKTEESIVASILSAIKYSETPASEPVIGSTQSAFTRLSGSSKIAVEAPESIPKSAFMPVKGPVNKCKSPETESSSATENDSASEDDLPLNEQIDELESVVCDVIAVIKELHSSVQNKCSSLEQDLDALNEKLVFEEEKWNKKIAAEKECVGELEKQLKEAVRKESSLRKELLDVREDLSVVEKDKQKMRSMVLDKSDKLQDVQEARSTIKKLKADLSHTKQQLDQKTAEVNVLRQSLDTALSKMEGQNMGQDIELINQNIMLKKQISQLQIQHMQLRKDGEELAAKANTRRKTLEENIKCAEREIAALDNMIDKIRQVMYKYREQCYHWPELRSIWPELFVKREATPAKF